MDHYIYESIVNKIKKYIKYLIKIKINIKI